ncbi:MAG: hypothetical protein J7M08_10200, partial [Planctomycetes bacterium]|nr:hypothetical protein [Planctomycetota bacterium]
EGEIKAVLEAYKAGQAAYDEGKLEEARSQLERVKGSDIALARGFELELGRMLQDVEAKLETEHLRKLARQEQEAEKLEEQTKKVKQLYEAIGARMKVVEEAVSAEDFERALSLLEDIQTSIKDSGAADWLVLKAQLEQAEEKTSEVQKLAAAAASREKVKESIVQLLDAAEKIKESDLLGAQAKVKQVAQLAAQHDMTLTEQQRSRCDRILEAFDARYGSRRLLVGDQCAICVQLSQQCCAGGEYEKACQLLAVVAEADPFLVSPQLRRQAESELDAIRRKVAAQMEKAKELVRRFDGLQKGAGEEALAVRDRIVQEAERARLAGPGMLLVARRDVQFLQEDYKPALEKARTQFVEKADYLLSRDELKRARLLSEAHLALGSVEMAQPYLEELSARASGEDQQWARQKLAALDQIKETIRKERLKAVGPEVKAVYELAEEYHHDVAQGQMEAARQVEGKLADARLRLGVKKAEQAMQRGAYDVAASALEMVSLERASDSLVRDLYRPMQKRVSSAVSAARHLKAAEDAFAAHRFAEAAAELSAAGDQSSAPEPLKIRMEFLVAWFEAVRADRAKYLEACATAERLLSEAGDRVKSLQRREDSWDKYMAAIKVFMSGQPEESETSLNAALAASEGLSASEVKNIRDALDRLTHQRKSDIENVEAVAAEAQELFENAQYIEAAKKLEGIDEMPGYALSADVREQVRRLQTGISAAEQKAEELYKEAVEARKQDDRVAVGRMLQELKSRYSHTRSYQRRL